MEWAIMDMQAAYAVNLLRSVDRWLLTCLHVLGAARLYRRACRFKLNCSRFQASLVFVIAYLA